MFFMIPPLCERSCKSLFIFFWNDFVFTQLSYFILFLLPPPLYLIFKNFFFSVVTHILEVFEPPVN